MIGVVVAAIIGAVEITPKALEGLLELRLALPVDVRSADAFRAGHIPGAINVPLDRIDRAANEIRSKAGRWTVVAYCGRADAALAIEAARRLRASGVPDVVALAGGFRAWQITSRPRLRSRGTS